MVVVMVNKNNALNTHTHTQGPSNPVMAGAIILETVVVVVVVAKMATRKI